MGVIEVSETVRTHMLLISVACFGATTLSAIAHVSVMLIEFRGFGKALLTVAKASRLFQLALLVEVTVNLTQTSDTYHGAMIPYSGTQVPRILSLATCTPALRDIR